MNSLWYREQAIELTGTQQKFRLPYGKDEDY